MRQIIVLLLLCISNVLIGQGTSIAGKIIDGDTGEEMIGANVTLYKGGVLSTGASTDFTGNYSINVDPGNYDVEVSYIGYSAVRITDVIVHANRGNRLDVQLGSGRWDVSQSFSYFQMNYQPLSIEEEENMSREELFNEAECNE